MKPMFPRPLKCPLSFNISLAHRNLGHVWKSPPHCPYDYLIKSCVICFVEYVAEPRQTSKVTAADKLILANVCTVKQSAQQKNRTTKPALVCLTNNSTTTKNSHQAKLFWVFFGPEVRQFHLISRHVNVEKRGKWDICSKKGWKMFITGFYRRFRSSQIQPNVNY